MTRMGLFLVAQQPWRARLGCRTGSREPGGDRLARSLALPGVHRRSFFCGWGSGAPRGLQTCRELLHPPQGSARRKRPCQPLCPFRGGGTNPPHAPPISLQPPGLGGVGGAGMEEASRRASAGGAERAGSYWQDPLAMAITPSQPLFGAQGRRGSISRSRALRVVYVLNEAAADAESQPLRCLREACREVRAELRTVPFDTLALGETGTLDCFYNADVAVVEVSNSWCQPSLFYHLGVRESFSMTNNVLLCCRADLPDLQALKEDICQKNSQDCCSTYTFIPYVVTAQNKVLCCDASTMKCLTELFQPSFNVEAFFTPLAGRLTKLLEGTPTNSCGYFRETIRQDIRKAREMYSGKQLSRELANIQQRLDSVALLSLDIVVNLLLSYRDVQDYDAMITLVETLQALPTCDVAEQNNIRFHYTFALERRNHPGDREKALSVLLPVVEQQEGVAPDLYCMCGRIYKDMFISSGFTDTEKRDQAYYWYSKAFDTEPSLHSGILSAVLLMAAGHQFETSVQLRQIGVKLSCLLGHKGSVEKMQHYWDVGFYLGAWILANDLSKVIRASEKLYMLNAPVWYLASVMETYLLYKHFKTCPEIKTPKQELADFWMGFLLGSCQPFVSMERCPVLILELTKVLQPAQLVVRNGEAEGSVTLCHVCPPEERGISSWTFPASSIRGISISKCDERCCFLYVLHTAEDFQLYFPTQHHCHWFCELIHSFASELVAGGEEAGSGFDEDLEYDYEYTETGDRVVLGKGTYGVVYAGRDLSSQVRIAIKEIPERDSRYSQPLHEEIALHKRLKHRNIVQYLGSISQDGFIKIFMEEVPGGSLSSLLRSKWGPLKDNEPTIVFYTKQILEGLHYLHDNQIVHRDIKGDNVLINTYSGVLKISDFGTSKRLAGMSPSAETFAGTLQYMAPEIIDQGPRGYGKPADIWSLGCTIIEMATGNPPFYELGSPQAAMFKVGMFKMHPEVPDSMSGAAKAFILRCFEADPDKRAPAAALLQEPFLTAPSRKKARSQAAPAAEGGTRGAASSPASERAPAAEGVSEARNRPSQAPRTAAKADSSLPAGSSNKVAQRGSYVGAPEESVGLDCSSSSAPEESSSMFLLKKDSERRATLHQILTEEQPSIVAALEEAQSQSWDGVRLSSEHIAQLVSSLKSYIRSPSRQQLSQDLLRLQAPLQAEGLSLHHVQVPLFSFQDTVKQLLRQHQIKPHWMFALDNLMGQAVQAAFTILLTELPVKPQRRLGKAQRGAREEEEEAEEDPEVQQAPPPRSQPREGTPSSGIGTGTSTQLGCGTPLADSVPLMLQLSQLRAETGRLQAMLLEKEREWQRLLRRNLQAAERDARVPRGARPLAISIPAAQRGAEDALLVDWLRSHGADEDATERFLQHSFTLPDLLTCATRDDLLYAGIRGGLACRLWGAIQEHRESLAQQAQREAE
ncbi:mitogen-activated protein kinase kinase kinase 6 [Emydura macquarii macquarii]|uniref:mitogen-activated protein kinase kinase kinase 6 n=1 Tax=Emydura macquarii macquarii TaxID=1129001 RepID=UPI003529F1E1